MGVRDARIDEEAARSKKKSLAKTFGAMLIEIGEAIALAEDSEKKIRAIAEAAIKIRSVALLGDRVRGPAIITGEDLTSF